MCNLVSGNTSFLLFDGKVSICCRDYSGELIIGDIKDNSLDEIRKSKKLLSLQKAHTSRNLENYNLCKNCFIIDDRINHIFNGFLRYIIYKNPKKSSEFYQSKVDLIINFLKKEKLSEKKFTEIMN